MLSVDTPLGRALETSLGGASAASFAGGEVAPPGYHWEFVMDDLTLTRITDDATAEPVVSLVGN